MTDIEGWPIPAVVEMTDAEREVRLDEPVSDAIAQYNPVTGQQIRTMRQYIEALRHPRHVAASDVRWKKRSLFVSTVHLVADHNWYRGVYPEAPSEPVVYETMIFGHTEEFDALGSEYPAPEYHDIGDFQARYPTAASARKGHEMVIRAITMRLIRARFTVVRHDRTEIMAEVVDPVVELPGVPGMWGELT